MSPHAPGARLYGAGSFVGPVDDPNFYATESPFLVPLTADAFPASLPASRSSVHTPAYYDNGSSISVTPCLDLLLDLVPLDTPFELGGIGHGVMVTHRRRLRFLPDKIALCYYSASAQATLISLGFL